MTQIFKRTNNEKEAIFILDKNELKHIMTLEPSKKIINYNENEITCFLNTIFDIFNFKNDDKIYIKPKNKHDFHFDATEVLPLDFINDFPYFHDFLKKKLKIK